AKNDFLSFFRIILFRNTYAQSSHYIPVVIIDLIRKTFRMIKVLRLTNRITSSSNFFFLFSSLLFATTRVGCYFLQLNIIYLVFLFFLFLFSYLYIISRPIK